MGSELTNFEYLVGQYMAHTLGVVVMEVGFHFICMMLDCGKSVTGRVHMWYIIDKKKVVIKMVTANDNLSDSIADALYSLQYAILIHSDIRCFSPQSMTNADYQIGVEVTVDILQGIGQEQNIVTEVDGDQCEGGELF